MAEPRSAAARPQRALLVAATTGYQAASFAEAADRLGIELRLATDRCHQLDDPWGDRAIPIRFEDPVAALRAVRAQAPFDGVLACGDAAAVLGAQLAAGLGVAFHPPRAAQICHDKFAFRQAMKATGLPTPWFRRERVELGEEPGKLAQLAAAVSYPCVLKPLMLSGSRGVIRADDSAQFALAFGRIQQLLQSPAVRGLRDPNAAYIQIEGFVAGAEYALEGWIAAGVLQRFALFEKPDPLDGPFFEENIYITPARLDRDRRAVIWDMVEAAARAVGLGPGPVHAEIRLAADAEAAAYVLEIAARPIGGLCGRTLRFERAGAPGLIGLEELLLRGALGEPIAAWEREPLAAGVMMIPIRRGGVLAGIDGVAAAEACAHIEAVEITAKPDQVLVALPEGASYLGFIFARGRSPEEVEAALRAAHAQLTIHWRETLPVR